MSSYTRSLFSCGKRQGSAARVAPLFTTPKHSTKSAQSEDPSKRSFANDHTVQHGLNPNPCTLATTASPIQYRTHLPHARRNGAPAVATRKHAPIRPQATLEATGNAVERWKDVGRDQSERPQCAKCTRWPHAASNVNHQAQAEQS